MAVGRGFSNVARSLFGEGHAAVIGLPPDFDFPHFLRESDHVRLATAFAHESGWNRLERSLIESSAQLDLVTGLDFAQTEPGVLWKWLRLQAEREDTDARLYLDGSGTFHPKVIIVTGTERTFAVVGSGNLSDGGLISNVECGVYTEDAVLVHQISRWFDEVFTKARPMTKVGIAAYVELYESNKIARKAQQRALEARVRKMLDGLRLADTGPPYDEGVALWSRWNKEGFGVALEVVRRLNRILRRAVPKREFHLTDEWRSVCAAVIYKDGSRLCDRGLSSVRQPLRLRLNKDSVTITGLIGGDDKKGARAKQEEALRPYFTISDEKPRSKDPAVRIMSVDEVQLRNGAGQEEMRKFFKRSLEWQTLRR